MCSYMWIKGGPCDGALVFIKSDLYPFRGSCDSETGITESRTKRAIIKINSFDKCDSTCYGEVFGKYCPGKKF